MIKFPPTADLEIGKRYTLVRRSGGVTRNAEVLSCIPQPASGLTLCYLEEDGRVSTELVTSLALAIQDDNEQVDEIIQAGIAMRDCLQAFCGATAGYADLGPDVTAMQQFEAACKKYGAKVPPHVVVGR